MTSLGHGTREQHPANKQRLTLHFSLHLGNLVSNYRVCLMAAVSRASLKASPPRAGAAWPCGGERGGGWLRAAPWEATVLPGHGMGTSLIPACLGCPTQRRVQALDTAREGSVPREEPLSAPGTCHTAALALCHAPGLIHSRGLRKSPLQGGGAVLCADPFSCPA